MYTPKDVVREPLYVVTSIFNPVRFKSRWKLYRDFQRHVRESGAILLTIEGAFGERDYALEEHAQPYEPNDHEVEYKSFGPPDVPASARMPQSRLSQDYIKIRIQQQQEIWLKENLLNIGVQHLPEDAKYIAFVDSDIIFTRPDWVSETLHALQHYDVVQMFSTAIDLTPAYEPFEVHRSFGYNHIHGIGGDLKSGDDDYYYYALDSKSSWPINVYHPGFAWAWRRSALNTVGSLMDQAILGAADHHMAWALVGKPEKSVPTSTLAEYRKMVYTWSDRAAALNYNIGYIDGTINHFFHGRKSKRFYKERWKILIENDFDPYIDLFKDWRGVYQLTTKKPKLRDDLRRYFRARDEDSTYLPDSDYRLVGAKPGLV